VAQAAERRSSWWARSSAGSLEARRNGPNARQCLLYGRPPVPRLRHPRAQVAAGREASGSLVAAVQT
jgi:hypothetical protein